MKPSKYGLTNREREVLALMVEGVPSKGIAEQLYVSVPTIRTHQRSIYEKLGVTSALEVVSKTLREELLKGYTIVRRIEFAPEHLQAGIAILSYFGTVLRQKHPNTKATVRIEQTGFSVRLVIITNDDEEEVIEKTLNDYGLVMSGRMAPSEYLSQPQHIMQLENKLELAHLELRFAQKQLDFEREGYRKRIIGLDQDVIWLREHVGKLLTDGAPAPAVEALASILREFHAQNDVALKRALKIIEKALLEPGSEKEAELNQALATIRSKSPTLFEKLKDFSLRAASSTAGRIFYELIVRFPA